MSQLLLTQFRINLKQKQQQQKLQQQQLQKTK